MNSLLFTLLTVPALVPVVLWVGRKTRRRLALAAVAVAVLLASLLAFGVAGMEYEDADRAMPLWWSVGLGAVQVEIAGLVVLGILAAVRRFMSGGGGD